MNPVQILVVGRHEEIMQTLLRLINANDQWQARGTLDDAEAMQLFSAFDFDMVLLSSGIDENCEDTLCAYFRANKPLIKIIQHYGGGSGLLSNEITQALHNAPI